MHERYSRAPNYIYVARCYPGEPAKTSPRSPPSPKVTERGFRRGDDYLTFLGNLIWRDVLAAATTRAAASTEPCPPSQAPGPDARTPPRSALLLRTERAYVDWSRRFILFHGKRHPAELGASEVEAFLTHLAVERSVAASTQNQAKAALLFLYKQVLAVDLPWLDDIVAARGGKRRLPVVLTPREARELLLQLSGPIGLVASLLYGSGLRLMECLRLRVKDVEFERREIVVREGKGGKDRVTVLPENLLVPLRQQLGHARALHQKDLAVGRGAVWLPDALALKFPNAPRAWGWQWVLLAARAAPLVRHSHAAVGLRHPHGAGAPRPRRREHHHGLHARAQQGRPRRAQPVRRALSAGCAPRAVSGGASRLDGSGRLWPCLLITLLGLKIAHVDHLGQ